MRAFDFDHGFGDRREHRAEVDFLKGFAAERIAVDLADEEQQGRRVLKRGLHADARVRRARSARYERDAGPAG